MGTATVEPTDPRHFVSRGLTTLVRWAHERELSQSALAEALGTSQPHVSLVVRHHSFPGPRLLVAIEAATKGASRPGDWYVPASADEVAEYRQMVRGAR